MAEMLVFFSGPSVTIAAQAFVTSHLDCRVITTINKNIELTTIECLACAEHRAKLNIGYKQMYPAILALKQLTFLM